VGVALSICTDAPYAALKDSLHEYRIVNKRAAKTSLKPLSRQTRKGHANEPFQLGFGNLDTCQLLRTYLILA
jgi:hypothetical protein